MNSGQLHLLVFNYLLLLVLGVSFSCGIITHIQIANRAKNFFALNSTEPSLQEFTNIIYHYSNYFEAGAPFPDWGYPFGYSNEAEFAHWPPFISSFIDYIKENYQKGSKRYEQLTAFIFGVSSHCIADVLWHWGKDLPHSSYEQGFIRSVKHYSDYCHDYNEKCHDLADTGGDLYLQYRGHLTRYSIVWYIPVNDICNVYQKEGYTVNKYALRGIMILIYLASYLEKEFGWFVWKGYEKNSSFIAENLDSYYHGGLDDMAIHTTYEWLNVIKHFNDTSSKVFSSHLTNLFERQTFNEQNNNNRLNQSSQLTIEEINLRVTKLISQLPKNSVNTNFDENTGDLKIMIDTSLLNQKTFLFDEQSINSNRDIDTKKKNLRSSIYPTKNYKIITNDVPLAYFGEGITVYNISLNGSTVRNEIALTSFGNGPLQTGAVYFYNIVGNSTINFNEITPDLKGFSPYSKFGYRIITIDINHDGIDDIVVSSPTEGGYIQKEPNEYNKDTFYMKNYTGKVYVFLGKDGKGIEKDSIPDYEIITKQDDDFYMNLGTFLAGSDCNNDGYADLLIGSPFASSLGDKRGNVAIFTNILNTPVANITENGTKIIYLEEADFYIQGTEDYEEIGTSIECGNGIVIIGKPGLRTSDTSPQAEKTYNISTGGIIAYSLDNSTQPLFNVTCDKADSRYGASLSLNYPYLAVGAPIYSIGKGYFQGRVFVYDISLMKGEYKYDEIEQIILEGSNNRMRFGKKIQFINNTLFISAPFYSEFFTHEKGRIYQFKNVSSLSKSNVINSEQADVIFESPINEPARFGENFLVWKDFVSQEWYLTASASYNLNKLNSGNVILGIISI